MFLERYKIVLLSGAQSFLSLIFFVFGLSTANKIDCDDVYRIRPPLFVGMVFAFVCMALVCLIAYHFWKEDQNVSPFAHLANEHIEGGEEEEPFA